MNGLGTATREDADKAFAILEKYLETHTLPTEAGGKRKASADEFMYMQTNGGYYQMKHHTTRNYILIDVVESRVIIPKTKDPFFLGFFDEPFRVGDTMIKD